MAWNKFKKMVLFSKMPHCSTLLAVIIIIIFSLSFFKEIRGHQSKKIGGRANLKAQQVVSQVTLVWARRPNSKACKPSLHLQGFDQPALCIGQELCYKQGLYYIFPKEMTRTTIFPFRKICNCPRCLQLST